jgi:hypothetical protein
MREDKTGHARSDDADLGAKSLRPDFLALQIDLHGSSLHSLRNCLRAL